MAEKGNLKVLNVFKVMAAGTEEDFVFTVPSGGDGEVLESTTFLERAVALASAGPDGNTFNSMRVVVKSLEILKKGASERTNLLSGTPNILEFSGQGMLPRLFTVIETSENNEDIVVRVANNDTVIVRVSLTLYLAVKTKQRDIAAQPANREMLPQNR